MASITRRPDGKWRARYRDREGKEHARHFPRKTDAQKWLDDTTTNITIGLWVDPKHSRDTVQGMATTWLASNPDWTVSTRVRNESIVELHILPRWGRVRLVDVTTEAIQEWTGSFSLAGGTVRKIVGVLSGILGLAVTLKRLAVNTATPVKLPKQSLGRRKYLTAVQVERMADGARDYSDVVLVLAYCGLRFGEMAALRVGNVDQLRRRFMIDESVTEVKGRMEWSTPKDHQRRSVPFPDFLDAAITTRMEGRGPRDLLFPSRKGEVMRIGNARRDWFDPAAVGAGFDGLTPHELRHTAASLTVATGASVLALQRMLGHDKPSTTLDVYSDLYDEDLDQIPERLASVRSRALADYLRTGPRLVEVPQVS